MATEFTVMLENRPGALADLAETMAQNAINILAIHATPCSDQGITQFIVNHPDAAIDAMNDVSMSFTTREVLLVTLVNEPGSLAHLARALANAGINVNALYIAMGNQVVLDVSDLRKAQEIAMSLGLR